MFFPALQSDRVNCLPNTTHDLDQWFNSILCNPEFNLKIGELLTLSSLSKQSTENYLCPYPPSHLLAVAFHPCQQQTWIQQVLCVSVWSLYRSLLEPPPHFSFLLQGWSGNKHRCGLHWFQPRVTDSDVLLRTMDGVNSLLKCKWKL